MAKKKPPKLTAKQKELFNKLNPLQQAFTQNILSGMKKGPAWTKACNDIGQKPSSDPSASAIQSLNSINVQAFLDSVREKTVEKQLAGIIMTREEGLEILTKLARAKHPGRLKKIRAKVGDEEREFTVVDMPDELSEDDLTAIEEMYNTKDGPRIKIASKADAITRMARIEDWDKRPDTGNTVNIYLNQLESKF